MHMQKKNGPHPFVASAMAWGKMHFAFRECRRGKMAREEQRHHRRRSGLHRQTATDCMNWSLKLLVEALHPAIVGLSIGALLLSIYC
jgi:hypothetical protein